ncbi:MAG: DUF4838 domain-containing protein [Victivallaceae bacterium]|nr:DUF4838 domain-containing protein [Victivallaceae bacterium]
MKIYILFISLSFTGLNILGFEVVNSNRPVATIVVPQNAKDSIIRAAYELKHHIKLASGAILKIEKENKYLKGNLIYLGNCQMTLNAGLDGRKMKMNNGIIKVNGNRMFIVGKDDSGNWLSGQNSVGTLWGVYELLNKYLGVCWLWPGKLGTFVPKIKNFSIQNVTHKIELPLNSSRWRVSIKKSGWISQANRQIFMKEQAIWLRRQRFGSFYELEYGHAFTKYWDRFHKSNPNFFNLLPNGKRSSDPFYYNGNKRLVSMCVSNSQFAKQIIQDWLKYRTVKYPYINGNENDTPGKCVCEKCLKWDFSTKDKITDRLAKATAAFKKGEPNWSVKLGSLSDRYARFYLEILKEADRVTPDAQAKVCGLIYANYSLPPRKTKLNNRVLLRLCPPIMFPWTDSKVRKYKKIWAGWNSTGAKLILRPNYTLDGHCFPIFYAKKFADCFKFAAKHGMIGTDFDSLKGSYAANGPTLYMVARLQRDFNVSVDQVLQDYYNAFGPAKKDIKLYFEYLQKVSNSCTDNSLHKGSEGGNFAEFFTKADNIFTPQVLKECNILLTRAKISAEKDIVVSARVKFLQLGLKQAELVIDAQKAFLDYKRKGNTTEFAQALKRLDDFRAKTEHLFISNMGYLEYFENRIWPRKAIKLASKDMTQLALKWKFKFDPQKHGEAKQWYMPSYKDLNWTSILVNEVWEKQQAGKDWSKKHNGQYNGIAWYRIKFKLPAKTRGKRIFLLFNAVDEACTVWVNGKKVLVRPYPYKGNSGSWLEAFEVDITSVIESAKPNQLTVKVIDNSGAGGIWKPVYLKILPKAISVKKSLIKNAGFEQADKFWHKQIPFGKIKLFIDKQNVHSGINACALKVIKLDKTKKYAGKYGTWGRWYQTVKGLKIGKKYKFQFWTRTSKNFDGLVMVWVRSGKTSKANISINWMATNGKWKMFSAEVIPEKASAIIYLNIAANKGSAWFDNVILCK